MSRLGVAAASLLACACNRTTPQPVGASMLNVQPEPLTFSGQLDFDLLAPVQGTACVRPDTNPRPDSTVSYWMGHPTLENIPAVARGVVAAAVLDAMERLVDADTLLVTRIVTEAKGTDESCAFVYGRGIRLKKARGLPDDDKGAVKPVEDEVFDERK